MNAQAAKVITKRSYYGLEEIWSKGRQVRQMGRFRLWLQLLMQSFVNMVKAPLTSIITILTIALALFFFGAFLLFVQNVQQMLLGTQSTAKMRFFLVENASDMQSKKLISEISELEGIREVKYISKENALIEFGTFLGEEGSFITDLEKSNPLPASIEIELESTVEIVSFIESLRVKYEDHSLIESIQYPRAFLTKLSSVVKSVQLWGWIGALLVLVLVGWIIANTIQLALHLRRDEIDIMRLVGAEQWYVGGPYIIEGFIQGALGALIALSFLAFAYFVFALNVDESELFSLFIIRIEFLSVTSILAVTLLGLFVGVVGSYIALRQFFRD